MVMMVQKANQSGKNLLDCFNWRCRVLVTAEIRQRPGYIAQVAKLKDSQFNSYAIT